MPSRGENAQVPAPWSSSDAVDAIRALRSRGAPNGQSGWAPVRVELEEPDVLLVVIEVGGEQLGVHYSLADMPFGPQTGLPYQTVDRWAGDVWGDIDEQIATGASRWADRIARPDGVTLLRW